MDNDQRNKALNDAKNNLKKINKHFKGFTITEHKEFVYLLRNTLQSFTLEDYGRLSVLQYLVKFWDINEQELQYD